MKQSKIQTCGAYSSENEYSFSIVFGDGPIMTLESLSKEDIYEIASCACALLPEEDYRTLVKS